MTTDSDATEWVAVAVVARPHALRGAVLLKPLTRDLDDLFETTLERAQLRQRGRLVRPVQVESMAVHKGAPYVFFQGVTDRTSAEALVGMELVVPREDMVKLPEGRWYFGDLEGLRVVDAESGADITLVLRAEEGPAHDFLVLAHPERAGGEVLLPLVPDLVPRIDLETRTAHVRIPEGLLDL